MGKYAKPSSLARKTAITTGIAMGAAIPLSLVTAPTAQAAPISAWDRIAECESNQRWNLSWGDADSTGGLQIQKRTWDEYGGRVYAAYPYQTSKENQIRIAEKILKSQGPGAWVCNAMVGYPLSGSNRNVDPFAGAPSTTPKPAPKPAPKPETKPDSRRPESHIAHDHYTVVKGDTLYDIAKAKKVKSWQELYRWNTRIVEDPDLIYPGEVLNVPRATGTSTPAPPKPTTPPVTAKFVKPGEGLHVTQSYGNPDGGYVLGYHTGTDLRTTPAAEGAFVVSITAGRVVGAGYDSAYGNYVQVKHSTDNRYSFYAHLRSKAVTVGQVVSAGTKLGELGHTPPGRFTFPHLHFEIRTVPSFGAGHFINPVEYMKSKGIVL